MPKYMAEKTLSQKKWKQGHTRKLLPKLLLDARMLNTYNLN